MAFQSGSQVNPALGRTDFTPFLQGAMQGAQAQARGAENIAAGLAGLGQQVASGMREQYKEAKEFKLEERKYRDTIASGMKILDVLSKTPDIPESVKKLLPQLTQGFGNPNVPLSEQAASATTLGNIFGAVLSSGLKTTMENAADNAAAQYANAVAESQGRPFSMVTPVSATAKFKGEQMAANLAKTKSETAENLREKAGASGRVMTPEEVAAIPAGTDYKGTPLPDGTIFVTGLSRSSPSATTNINMGENAYSKRGGEVLFDRDLSEYDAANAAPDRIEKLDTVLDLIKEGNITTGFGAELVLNANRVRAKFLNDKAAGKTVSNTELLSSLLSSDVFPMIGSLNIGARGMDTPAEREFLREAFTGTKEFDPATLKRLTEIRRDIELRSVKKFKQNYEKGTYKQFFEQSKRPVPDFSSIPPKDVTSAEWAAMTPEQKSLWDK